MHGLQVSPGGAEVEEVCRSDDRRLHRFAFDRKDFFFCPGLSSGVSSVHVSAGLTVYLCISAKSKGCSYCSEGSCLSGGASVSRCVSAGKLLKFFFSFHLQQLGPFIFLSWGVSIDGTDGPTVRGLIPTNPEVTKPDKYLLRHSHP